MKIGKPCEISYSNSDEIRQQSAMDIVAFFTQWIHTTAEERVVGACEWARALRRWHWVNLQASSGMLRGNESRIREVSSKDNVTTPPTSPSGGASSEEVAALQAQCKELQGEASRAVELTVEITSLRNKASLLANGCMTNLAPRLRRILSPCRGLAMSGFCSK